MCIGALGDKKNENHRAEKEVRRYLQQCGYNTRTWRTDGRMDTGWQQRPRLRIASRGKNVQLRYPRQFLRFMVIYIRYGLGALYKRTKTRVVRFRYLVLRQKKYNMCQRVASAVPFDPSSLVSCAPFIIQFFGNFCRIWHCRLCFKNLNLVGWLAGSSPISRGSLDMKAVIRG